MEKTEEASVVWKEQQHCCQEHITITTLLTCKDSEEEDFSGDESDEDKVKNKDENSSDSEEEGMKVKKMTFRRMTTMMRRAGWQKTTMRSIIWYMKCLARKICFYKGVIPISLHTERCYI